MVLTKADYYFIFHIADLIFENADEFKKNVLKEFKLKNFCSNILITV